MSADITFARVRIEALCSDDVRAKLELNDPLVPLDQPPEEGEYNPRCKFEAELPVLTFSEQLLNVDGYTAVRLLTALRIRNNELWFCFGAFRSRNGKRHQIVLRGADTPKCLAVLDWEILEWTKRKIHHF